MQPGHATPLSGGNLLEQTFPMHSHVFASLNTKRGVVKVIIMMLLKIITRKVALLQTEIIKYARHAHHFT